METILTILYALFIFYIFQRLTIFRKKKLVEKIMQESIDLFKRKKPEQYKKIMRLHKEWGKEMIDSGHLGMYRDGSESDRRLNIQQDSKVNALRKELEREVELAHFRHYVSDVMRKYGDDEKLSLALLNYQSGTYTGTEVTIISKRFIGFDRIPADRLL
jgi:hypothetical protein